MKITGIVSFYDLQIFQNADLRDDKYVSLHIIISPDADRTSIKNKIDVIMRKSFRVSQIFVQMEVDSKNKMIDSTEKPN